MDLSWYKCINTDMKIVWTAVVWPKGQIVIPKDVRDLMWLETWTNLVVAMKYINWKPVWIGLVKNDIMQDFLSYIWSEINTPNKSA